MAYTTPTRPPAKFAGVTDPIGPRTTATMSETSIPTTTDGRRQRAIGASLLAAFPPAARDQLLADAIPITLPAGGVLYRDADEPRCALVVAGLARVFLSAPDGRTVTIRYARYGELLGIPIIVAGPIPVSMQMVTDGELLILSTRALRHLGQTESRIGWLLAEELARRLIEMYGAVADNAFGTLRERVARNLLDLAAVRDEQRLVADVTQQALAEAVGSTRPAVARVLGELRQAGLVVTGTRDIELLDPERLHALLG